jgi:hypothetical protein
MLTVVARRARGCVVLLLPVGCGSKGSTRSSKTSVRRVVPALDGLMTLKLVLVLVQSLAAAVSASLIGSEV